MYPVLANFRIIKPENELTQDEIIEWTARVQAKATPDQFNERLLKRFSVSSNYIAKRSLFNQDIGNSNSDDAKLYTKENDYSPGLDQRSKFYQATVDQVFEDFYQEEKQAPGEILHVTCTGYVSPSAGQKLIPRKGWSRSTGITHLYHMGCYAAMPAIKVAKGMTEKKRIDIVHTELCSLHFDIKAQNPEQTVVQTLFADGAIKYSLYPNNKTISQGISVIQMKEVILPDSEDAMSWAFNDKNLAMTLHPSIPRLVKENLNDYIQELFKSAGLNFEDEKEKAIFAIHPGGPKIIQEISELLNLTGEQISHSLNILKTRGNMSSATLPHIWDSIIQDSDIKSGTKILSVAFGPGLTIAGFLGEKL